MRTAFECTHNLIVIWYSFRVDRKKRNTQTWLCSCNRSLEKLTEIEKWNLVLKSKIDRKKCSEQNNSTQNRKITKKNRDSQPLEIEIK